MAPVTLHRLPLAALAGLLLLLALPLAAHAAAQSADCAPGTAVAVDDAELFLASLTGQEPIVQGCSSGYSCSPMFGECPDIIDTPPGECINGCCVYESECQSTCHFDSDCGPQASCWGNCCYSWNR